MPKLLIDFGGSSCAGRCGHCRFGTAKPTSAQTFSEESLALLARLVSYAKGVKDSVRLAYMTPLWKMEEPPLIDGEVDVISIPLSTPQELDTHGDVIFQTLRCFKGRAIELSLNHYPISQFDIGQHLGLVYQYQLQLFTGLPQLEEVYFGLNHNTISGEVSEIQNSCILATLAYIRWIERSWQTKDFGESQAVFTGTRDSFHTSALVPYNDKTFGFGCRYLLAHDASEAARSESTIGSASNLNLALLQAGVHVGHSTHSINNPVYWFSYSEFDSLITRSEQQGLSLKNVCQDAINLRLSS